MRTWLLQANPDTFDVDTYVSEYHFAYWSVPDTVKKYRSEIREGDDVYVWRASGKQKAQSGVIAKGIVREECAPKSKIKYPDAVGDSLWKEGSSEKSDIKVGFEVQEVRLSLEDGMILRKDVTNDDLLSKMRVVTSQVGTIFKIPKDQAESLQELWESKSRTIKYPIISHSWRILSDSVAIKVMDKSSFLHYGSGIPAEIADYFDLLGLYKEKRKDAVIKHKDSEFKAHFEIDNEERYRFLWRANLSNLIKKYYPAWYDAFSNGIELNHEPPHMRFRKIDNNEQIYEVDFIYKHDIDDDIEADIVENQEPKTEGAVKTYYGKRYERDPDNRRLAIEYHGTTCIVCGFNYEERYGERGLGFIEIHHTKPLSTFENEQVINPETDLAPVCANCHRMIHRRQEDVLSIHQMQEIMRKRIERI